MSRLFYAVAFLLLASQSPATEPTEDSTGIRDTDRVTGIASFKTPPPAPPATWEAWAAEALKTGGAKLQSATFTQPFRLPRSSGMRFCGDSERHTLIEFTGISAGEPCLSLNWNHHDIEFARFKITRDTPGPIFAVSGLEASWFDFRHITFEGVGDGRQEVTAIVLGDGATGNNSDTTLIDRCQFRWCKHALVLDHKQSILSRLRDCRVLGGESVVFIRQGGDLVIDNLSCYGAPTVVRTIGGGRNNAGITIINPHVDGWGATMSKGVTLLDASGANAMTRCQVIGGSCGSGHDEPILKLFYPGKFTEVTIVGTQLGDTPTGLEAFSRTLEATPRCLSWQA